MPTWSPLKDSKATYNELIDHQTDWNLLPNRFVGLNTSCLDPLGRVSNFDGCEMHLQGVLVNLTLCTPTHQSHGLPTLHQAYPTGYGDADKIMILWDDEEEAASAASAPDNHFRALSMAVSPSFSMIETQGIILKALVDRKDPQYPRSTRRWVRCGYFRLEGTFSELEDVSWYRQRQAEIEDAYQIASKYGLRWELENPEDILWSWRWRQTQLHDPVLEHICLV